MRIEAMAAVVRGHRAGASRSTRSLACAAVGLGVLLGTLAPRGAAAQLQLRGGAMNVGLGVAGSVSHDFTTLPTETVVGAQLSAHLGYIATDEHGEGWLRGNLELALEPTLLVLSQDGHTSTLAGASAFARWIFVGSGTVRPFLEVGIGALGGRADLVESTCQVNFPIQGGPGVLVFLSDRTALSVAYRFQHMSNGSACAPNDSLHSSVVQANLTYFFH